MLVYLLLCHGHSTILEGHDFIWQDCVGKTNWAWKLQSTGGDNICIVLGVIWNKNEGFNCTLHANILGININTHKSNIGQEGVYRPHATKRRTWYYNRDCTSNELEEIQGDDHGNYFKYLQSMYLGKHGANFQLYETSYG